MDYISEPYANNLLLLSCARVLYFTWKKRQGTFRSASWRGIQVAVKLLGEELFTDEEKMWVGRMLCGFFVFVFLPFLAGYTCGMIFVLTGILMFDSFRNAFRDELALLQKLRHPNIVQFLGAVTQSIPMMIVTEYLPKVLSMYPLLEQ